MSAYKFNKNNNIITIDVVVAAKRTAVARFALDTGATNVILSSKLADLIGIERNLKNEEYMFTASKLEKVPIVTIPKITVISKTAKNVKAMIMDLPKGARVDGLLGLSYLKNFKLTVDFKKGEIRLD